MYNAIADGMPCPLPLTLLTPSHTVEAMAIHSPSGLLAVGDGCNVTVADFVDAKALYTLEGHDAPVTTACFCEWAPQRMVTTAEDRTFKVWDLQQQCVVYQSAVLSAAVPTCIALDPSFPRFVTLSMEHTFGLCCTLYAEISPWLRCRTPDAKTLRRQHNSLVS